MGGICSVMAFRVCLMLLAMVGYGSTADCDLNQLRRAGDPSGQQIASALTVNNQLPFVCGDNFPPGSTLIATFNHGSMVFNVTRGSAQSPLELCQDGFQNIIDQCILDGNSWGGVFNFNDKRYRIYNAAYPSNGLNFGDDGGPPLPSSTITTSTTLSTSKSSTAISQPAQTIMTETDSRGSVIVGTVSTLVDPRNLS